MSWLENFFITAVILMALGVVGFGVQYFITSTSSSPVAGRTVRKPESPAEKSVTRPVPADTVARDPDPGEKPRRTASDPARPSAPETSPPEPPVRPKGEQENSLEKMSALDILNKLNTLLKEGHRNDAFRLVLEIVRLRPDAFSIFLSFASTAATQDHELVGAYAMLNLYLATANKAQETPGLRDYLQHSVYPRMLTLLSYINNDPGLKNSTLNILNHMFRIFGADAAAVNALTSQLHEQDVGTRRELAIMFGITREPSVIPVLTSLYNTEKDMQAKSFVLWSLGNFNPSDLQSFIPEVRRAMEAGDINATIAMARWGEKTAGPPLVESLRGYSSDEYGGSIVTAALIKLNDPSLISKLQELRQSKDWKVEVNASILLGHYGNAEGKEALGKAMNDRALNSNVQMFAACALGYLGEESVRPRLDELSRSPQQNVAAFARKAIEALDKTRPR